MYRVALPPLSAIVKQADASLGKKIKLGGEEKEASCTEEGVL